MTNVIRIRHDNHSILLAINGIEYRYEASYYHVQKFLRIYRKSPLRAMNYIKKNSYSEKKTERVFTDL